MKDEIKAQRLTAARVLLLRDASEDIVLRMTGSIDGDVNYIMSREEFVRLATSLSQDAQRLSTMQKGDKPS